MIKCKEDLRIYLEADRIALGRKNKRPALQDLIWRYEIALRKCEYYSNQLGLFNKACYYVYKVKLHKLGVKCNYTIAINSVDMGLSIAHIGPIVISNSAQIGKNCRIHIGVNIGTMAGNAVGGKAPIIGDNVYIGPGAKLFGDIKIGNGIAIGANAVVNKSFESDNVTLGGIPARVISEKGSEGMLIKGSELV